MEKFLNKKNISVSVFILIIIVSLLMVAKLINEIKTSPYVGRGNQPANVISVEGKGEVTAVSDIATLVINLSRDSKTAKEAQDLLNTQITNILKYLKDQKIADKDIKSEYGGLTPKYSYSAQPVCYSYPCPPTKDPVITGYIATQSITVKIREVDNASAIRTGLATVGVTDISGPTFSIDNQDALNDSARALAIKDARAKAGILARELGVKLGKVVSFADNNGGYYPPMYNAKAMMADSASGATPVPVLPKGENKITSNITITYEIR
jgi:uncharacterized protein